MLAAVSETGDALRFAADALKADREIVMAAVSKDGGALIYAADALKADREIVLAAVSQARDGSERQRPLYFVGVSDKLRNDPELIALDKKDD